MGFFKDAKDAIKDAKVEEQKVSGKYEKFTIER